MKIINLSASLEEKLIFKDISVSINPGELHIISGPNGSGKSSLALTLMGHPSYTVTQGTIELDGEDITHAAVHVRAQKGIYLALQYPPTLPGITVFRFFYEAYQALDKPSCDTASFENIVYSALDTVGLSRNFAQRAMHDGFSGGEKKRLELAQILVLKPRIIILDEIDSGLDKQGIESVINSINHIRNVDAQARILCITHNNMFAEKLLPTKIHIMHAGTMQ